MVNVNRSQHESSRFLRHLHLFLQPVSEYSSLWVLDVSQHVVFRDGTCILHCHALDLVDIGRHSHDRLVVHSVDAQHSYLCSDSVVVCCLALGAVEVGRHNHDCLFVQPVDVFSRLWILDASQHVLSRYGPYNLRCLALGIVEIGRHSHEHLLIQPVDVHCHLWNHDISQPDQSHDGPCILRCLVLEIVEIGQHSHDHVVFLKLDDHILLLDLLVILDVVHRSVVVLL